MKGNEMKEKVFHSLASFEKSVDKENEVITLTGWAYKSYDDMGKPILDRDGETIEFDGFELQAHVLLAYHDHTRPIGTVELSKHPQGIKFVAKAHKEMDSQVYYALKNGIINATSIGFMPTSMKYIEVDGEEYVSFNQGVVFELSAVTIPANRFALIESVKSIVKDGKCVGLSCSVAAAKALNPDCGCPMEQVPPALKSWAEKHGKSIDYDENMKSFWSQIEMLEIKNRAFQEAVFESFFETYFGDKGKDDCEKALEDSFMSYKADVMHTYSSCFEDDEEKLKDKSMTKDTEETVVETPVIETPVVETPTEIPVVEEPTEEPVVEETPSEEPTEEPVTEETPKEEPTEDLQSEEQPAAAITYGSAITEFENLGLSSLEVLPPQAIEHLYNLASALGIQSITDKVEAAIASQIQNQGN